MNELFMPTGALNLRGDMRPRSIAVSAATLTSNTFSGCGASVAVADSSSGTSIENGVGYYEWSGKPYATASSLYSAVGQGRHDDDSRSAVSAAENSPLINSANSAAVGELPRDRRRPAHR
jgi:hypothetical protein